MVAEKTRKRRKKSPAPMQMDSPERSGWIHFSAAASAGALLGLCAPGFDQWYLAWVGLVPLLLLVASSVSLWQAARRGLTFGLVYLHWYLGLYPLDWLGFNDWQGRALALAAWLCVALHQGFIVAAFAAACRILPLTGGFLPRKVEERWHLPALVAVPLLWVLVENKVGNAPDLLGVPWSMIEYSQYRQLALLQAARWVGGIGIAALIVMVNVALAGTLATLSRRAAWKSLACATTSGAAIQLLAAALLVSLTASFGLASLSASRLEPKTALGVVQGNINIDMQKTAHRYTLADLTARYRPLIERCPPGICILTESALPTYLHDGGPTAQTLSALARGRQLDLVAGAMDRDRQGRAYNSAFGVTRDGRLVSTVYHKRYLVPFGEYTPRAVEYMPEWVKRLTNTPAGGGFRAGNAPAVLWMSGGRIAPLICFETISPELVAESVRDGGALLVNLSDLAWFHDSMIGQQMLAFSVMRAVESKRYFVFAANSGPSAVIDPDGRITSRSRVDEQTLLLGKVGFLSDLTPFTLWFR